MDPKRYHDLHVKGIKRAKDIEEALKIWCPNPGQEDQECSSRYSNWLVDMDDGILDRYSDMILQDKMKSNLDIDHEYLSPGGRACVFYHNLELPIANRTMKIFEKNLKKDVLTPRVKVIKLTLRGVTSITVTQDYISAGPTSHCGEIFDPIVIIQDFFGRTMVFDDYGTFVFNPHYQNVTAVFGDESYSQSFRMKPMVTDIAFYISFWSMVEATFKIEGQNADVVAIHSLDTNLIKEAIEGALELETENYGRLVPFDIGEDDDEFWPLVCKKIPWIRYSIRQRGFLGQSSRRYLNEEDPDFIKSLCTCRIVNIVN